MAISTTALSENLRVSARLGRHACFKPFIAYTKEQGLYVSEAEGDGEDVVDGDCLV